MEHPQRDSPLSPDEESEEENGVPQGEGSKQEVTAKDVPDPSPDSTGTMAQETYVFLGLLRGHKTRS
jgi:hypothetical protein